MQEKGWKVTDVGDMWGCDFIFNYLHCSSKRIVFINQMISIFLNVGSTSVALYSPYFGWMISSEGIAIQLALKQLKL